MDIIINEIRWTSPNGTSILNAISSDTELPNSNNHTSTVMIGPFRNTDSGNYTCIVTTRAVSLSNYITADIDAETSGNIRLTTGKCS